MIGLVVTLLVALVVLLVIRQIIPLLGLGPDVTRIVYLILGLIFLLWIVGLLTGYAPLTVYGRRY